MKILLVALNHTPEQTGIGKYQGEMATWLASQGHEVHAISAPPYYPEWRVGAGYSSWKYLSEIIDEVRVTRVPIYIPSTPNGFKRLLHLVSFFQTSFPVIVFKALFWRPDAIVLTAPPLLASPAVLLAGWISGARTFLHVQDFEVDAAFNLGLLKNPWLRRLALWLERAALRAFSGVSTISPKMRDKLIEKGVSEERTAIIPNWSNVHEFDPSQNGGVWVDRFKRNSGAVLAVYSGNLGRKQGLETIVEAARILKDHKEIHFIVSGDGAGRKDMESQAEGLPNITFLPIQPMDEFVRLMLAADIHLLPQKAEAADLVMPSKLGNILASGRPVVASAAEGTQVFEAVQGCGLTVRPDNAHEFASAIEMLAADPELRSSLGRRSRERALDEWGKESLLRRMEKMLQHGEAGGPSSGK